MRVSGLTLGCTVWLLVAAGCATPTRVQVDRDPEADLSEVASFAVEEAPPASGDPEFGPTARRVAREALVEALEAHGLREGDPAAGADVLVSARTERRPSVENARVEVHRGVDVHRRRTGVRTPLGDVPLSQETVVVPRTEIRSEPGVERERREVVVDVRRAAGGAVVWRGRARLPGTGVDPELLRGRIAAIMERYPGD